MWLYLLLVLPALTAYLLNSEMSRTSRLFVWGGTVVLTCWLMPIGSRDYTTYLRDFIDIGQVGFLEAVGQDPLYGGAVWLFGYFGVSGEVFYAAFSALGLWIKFGALCRLSGNKTIVILLYVASYFFLHDFTQIRAGLAIGIWMYALSNIEKDRRRYYFLTVLASLIHVQAAIGFLVPGILYMTRSSRGRLILSGLVVIIVALAATSIFDELGYAVLAAIPDPRTAIYLKLAAEGIWDRPNPYSFLSMLALATSLIGLHFRRCEVVEDVAVMTRSGVSDAVFCALLLGVCALTVLSSVSVAAFRISEHFFALLPLGVWLASLRSSSQKIAHIVLLLLAGMLSFIFIFYSPYLLDPSIGAE
jgi:hypothetical protein